MHLGAMFKLIVITFMKIEVIQYDPPVHTGSSRNQLGIWLSWCILQLDAAFFREQLPLEDRSY